eukprot:Awhi_evm1s3530
MFFHRQIEANPGTTIIGFQPETFSNFKPNLKESEITDISIFFSGTSFTDVPAMAFENSGFTTISFDDNPMSGTIDANAFKGTTALRSVTFARTDMETVPTAAVKNIPSVKSITLGLGENLNLNLANKVFDGLTVKELALDSNSIRNIDATMFQGLTSDNLVLANNYLTAIDESAFSGVNSSIAGLDFSYARMTASVLAGVLNNLTNLKSLVLKGNNFYEGTATLFAGLNLDLLSLSRVNMTSFNSEDLDCRVKELDLTGNKIQNLGNVFGGDRNSELETLWLEQCNLTTIDTNAFKGLVNLKNLYMGENFQLIETALGDNKLNGLVLDILSLNECGLTSVGHWLSDVSVQRLILSKNKITEVTNSAFGIHKSLVTLTFNDNLLEALPTGIFDGQINLKEVDFSGNPDLRRVDNVFRDFPYLESLSLARCALNSITEDTFKNLTVETLDLSFNSIETVLISKLSISNLTSLDLRNNQIKVFPTEFFKELDSLSSLDLTKNEIITVKSEQFSALKALKYLSFEGNSGLTEIGLYAFSGLKLDVLLFDSCPLRYLNSGTFDGLEVDYLSFYEMGELTGFDPGTFTNVVIDKLEFGDCPFTNHSLPQVVNEHMTQYVFATCQINHIPSGYFRHIPNVIRIIQDVNDLPLMKKEWYEGSNLIYIQSQFVKAEAFEDGFFEVANQLTGIVHSYNNFREITENMFNGAGKLFYNTFYNNSIVSVHPKAYNGKVQDAHRFYYDHSVPCERMQGIFEYFGNASQSGGAYNKRTDNNIRCANAQGVHINVPRMTVLQPPRYYYLLQYPKILNFDMKTESEKKKIYDDVKAKIIASGIKESRIRNVTIMAANVPASTRRRDTTGIEVQIIIDGDEITKEVSAEELQALGQIAVTIDGEDIAQASALEQTDPVTGATDPCTIDGVSCCSRKPSSPGTFLEFNRTTNQCEECPAMDGCRLYDGCECIACEEVGWTSEGFVRGNKTVGNVTTFHEGNFTCVNLEQNTQTDGLDTKDKIIIGVCCSAGAIIICICIIFFAMKTRAKRDKLGGMTPTEFVNGGSQSTAEVAVVSDIPGGGTKNTKAKSIPVDGYVTVIT